MAFRLNWSLLTPVVSQKIRLALNQRIRSYFESEKANGEQCNRMQPLLVEAEVLELNLGDVAPSVEIVLIDDAPPSTPFDSSLGSSSDVYVGVESSASTLTNPEDGHEHSTHQRGSILKRFIDPDGLSIRFRLAYAGNLRAFVRCVVHYTVDFGVPENGMVPPLRLSLPIHAELTDVRFDAILSVIANAGAEVPDTVQIMFLRPDPSLARNMIFQPLGSIDTCDQACEMYASTPLVDFSLTVAIGAFSPKCLQRHGSSGSGDRSPFIHSGSAQAVGSPKGTRGNATRTTRSFSSFSAMKTFNALSSSLFVAVSTTCSVHTQSRQIGKDDDWKGGNAARGAESGNRDTEGTSPKVTASPPPTCMDETVIARFLRHQIQRILEHTIIEPNALTILL